MIPVLLKEINVRGKKADTPNCSCIIVLVSYYRSTVQQYQVQKTAHQTGLLYC